MARSPSAFRDHPCDCPSRSHRRACRCSPRRPDPRRDRPSLSLTEGQIDFRSYQSYGSLDTQLTSIEEPQSPGSTYSTVSHDNVSSVTSTTADLEEQRHTSPPFVATPASSDSSFGYSQQYFYQQPEDRFALTHSLTWPSYGRDGQSLSHVTPIDQPVHVLAGIDRLAQSDEAVRLARQRLEFVSPQGPSPIQHQQYPKRHEPWTTQSLRSEDLMQLDRFGPQPMIIDTAVSPTSLSEKSSRRIGPLSPEARRNANLVRQARACRRCVYMKETCNEGTPCRSCKGKKGRKWKGGCMRLRLDELRHILFPAPIANRHALSEVNRYIYNSGFFYLDRPAFKLKLETGFVSRPLEVIVKEIEVMNTACSELQAFQTRSDSENGTVKATTLWNPPVVLYMTNKDLDVQQLKAQLRHWMEAVFDARNTGPPYMRWPWPCFEHPRMNWEGEVVEAIQEYYCSNLPSHTLLQKAQCLLFFGYILDHSFVVSDDSRPILLANLHNPPSACELDGKDIGPETVTRFIKMIVCGYALDLAKSVLTGLQDILHIMALGKETSTARTDLAFCLTFLLLVFLAQSQNRILMLAELSKQESGINLSLEEAEKHMQEMEDTLGSYMIHFHEFAVKRRKPGGQQHHILDAEEQHARDKKLMETVAELFSQYSRDAPETLDFQRPNIEEFDVQNTHRLCWKFVSALLDR